MDGYPDSPLGTTLSRLGREKGFGSNLTRKDFFGWAPDMVSLLPWVAWPLRIRETLGMLVRKVWFDLKGVSWAAASKLVREGAGCPGG